MSSAVTDFAASFSIQNPHFIELRLSAWQALTITTADKKVQAVQALHAAYQANQVQLDCAVKLANDKNIIAMSNAIPGRPVKPQLVHPLEVKQRSMRTTEGRAILLHALTHIEFNAINLALDAIWRFDNMPPDYYGNWLQVAFEEALHFSLLAEHLTTFGYQYGDFPAHNTLWEMVAKTSNDVLARMALVQRTMEARGLDAAPSTRNKLAQVGDHAGALIIDIILRDEVGHVAIGNRWFNYLCQQRNIDPIQTYEQLATQYRAPKLRAPFNLEARRQAGFTEAELTALQININ